MKKKDKGLEKQKKVKVTKKEKKKEIVNEEDKLTKGQIILYSIIIFLLIVIIIILFVEQKDNVDEEIVDEYYSYLGSNDLALCNGLYLYGSSTQKESDLDDDVKICNAYLNLKDDVKEEVVVNKTKKTNSCKYKSENFAVDEYKEDHCTLNKITKEDIDAVYQKVYGKSIDKYVDFSISDNEICYFIDDAYYCGLAENFSYSLESVPKTYRSVLKTTKNDEKIEIYDIMLRIESDKCYGGFTAPDEIEKCSKKYSNDKKIDVKLLKKYGYVYRHTFKRSDDTNEYYWYSTELL